MTKNRVLLVEDNEDNLELVRFLLERLPVLKCWQGMTGRKPWNLPGKSRRT